MTTRPNLFFVGRRCIHPAPATILLFTSRYCSSFGQQPHGNCAGHPSRPCQSSKHRLLCLTQTSSANNSVTLLRPPPWFLDISPFFSKKFKKISSTQNGGGQEDNDVLLTRNWWISAKSLSSPSSSFTCWPYRNIILIPTISCCGHFNRRKKALDVERRGPPGPFISSIVSPLLKHPPPKKKKIIIIFFFGQSAPLIRPPVLRERQRLLFFFGRSEKNKIVFLRFEGAKQEENHQMQEMRWSMTTRVVRPHLVLFTRNVTAVKVFEIFSVRKCSASLNWLPNEMIKCH